MQRSNRGGFHGGSNRGSYYKNKYGGGGRKRDNEEYNANVHDNQGTQEESMVEDDQELSTQPAKKGSMSFKELQATLGRINRKGYGAYKDIYGRYEFPDFSLIVDRVQADPFAPPSNFRVIVRKDVANFPLDTYSTRLRNTALCDFLTRRFYYYIHKMKYDERSSEAKGGNISIDKPGQHILERSSVTMSNDGNVEARFTVALPAFGRTVVSELADTVLTQCTPDIVRNALCYKQLKPQELYQHITSTEDQEYLRSQLASSGLIAFVRDGACLPREHGVSDKPMPLKQAILFKSPDILRREFTLPNSGKITGMGIPVGVTLIVGGGFHGKTTLLNALEMGVYNHIPGDGREFVVTDPNASKIRAEDGRSITCVNISPFIDNLPFNKPTNQFSTADGSGSTSQAANIIESLEAGATTLLIDEDTSATNFMIRDKRMQMLVKKEKEPITPFIHKVRSLLHNLKVSTVLVIGGSGDYFEVADTVIMMDSYSPTDVTKEAKEIAHKFYTDIASEAAESFGQVSKRVITSLLPPNDKAKVTVATMTHARINHEDLDLSGLEQLAEISQTRCIAQVIVNNRSLFNGTRTMKESLDVLEQQFQQKGLDAVNDKFLGSLARPRRLEMAAAINRLRTLQAKMYPSGVPNGQNK